MIAFASMPPVQEGVHRQGHAPRLPRLRVRIPKGDLPVGEAFNALIGDRHAIDVARAIERRVSPTPNLRDVDGPAAASRERVVLERARPAGLRPPGAISNFPARSTGDIAAVSRRDVPVPRSSLPRWFFLV